VIVCRRFRTTYRSHLQESILRLLSLEDGADSPETSVTTYLRHTKITEHGRPQLHPDGSVNSRMIHRLLTRYIIFTARTAYLTKVNMSQVRCAERNSSGEPAASSLKRCLKNRRIERARTQKRLKYKWARRKTENVAVMGDRKRTGTWLGKAGENITSSVELIRVKQSFLFHLCLVLRYILLLLLLLLL
jgi:hypothetical protein